MVAYGSFYLVVDNRKSHQESHLQCFQFREHVLLDNFFYDKRYSDDDFWFHIGECLEDNLRTRYTCKEVDVATAAHFVNELECQAVHVCHRQH